MDVFKRLLAGEAIPTTNPIFKAVGKRVDQANEISNRLNAAKNQNEIIDWK